MVKHEGMLFFLSFTLGVLQPAGHELDLLPFLACGGAKFGLFSRCGVGKGNFCNSSSTSG